MMVLHHSVGPGNARPSFTGALGGFRFESRSSWMYKHGKVGDCRTTFAFKAIDAVMTLQLSFRLGEPSHVE